MILSKGRAAKLIPHKYRVHFEFKQNEFAYGILSDKNNRPRNFSTYRDAYKAKLRFQQKTGCPIACVVAIC